MAQTDELPKADAVIIAVAHRQYREYSPSHYENFLKPNAVLIDVKGILDAEHFKALGHTVWAL